MVYIGISISSLAGSVFYWSIMQYYFQEDGVHRAKSKKLLYFIDEHLDFITNHKYFNEVKFFRDAFPFQLLKVDLLDITEAISILLIYPNG